MKIDNLKVPFAQVPNELLSDQKMSFKAKGLWAYIQSKPNDYDFSAERIVDETKDGVDSIQSALKELEEVGYLMRTRLNSGRVIYALSFPKLDNPIQGKVQRGKRPVVSKNNSPSIIKDKVSITCEQENTTEVKDTPANEAQSFFDIVITSAEEFQVLVSKMSESTKFPPAFVAEELKLFTLYWTERNKSGKKQKWESEKTFEVRRRLVTWFNNKRTNFGRNNASAVNGGANKYQVDFTKK